MGWLLEPSGRIGLWSWKGLFLHGDKREDDGYRFS